jgi:hypothetical protein
VCAGPCRPCEQCVPAAYPLSHPFGAHDERAIAIDGGASYLVARCFGHRHGLAGNHRFVHSACPFKHSTVDGSFFSRFHPQPVTYPHNIKRNLLFRSLIAQAPRLVGRQLQQLLKAAGNTGVGLVVAATGLACFIFRFLRRPYGNFLRYSSNAFFSSGVDLADHARLQH